MALLWLWQPPGCCGCLTSVSFETRGFLILDEAALALWYGFWNCSLETQPRIFFSLFNDSISYEYPGMKSTSFNLVRMDLIL